MAAWATDSAEELQPFSGVWPEPQIRPVGNRMLLWLVVKFGGQLPACARPLQRARDPRFGCFGCGDLACKWFEPYCGSCKGLSGETTSAWDTGRPRVSIR